MSPIDSGVCCVVGYKCGSARRQLPGSLTRCSQRRTRVSQNEQEQIEVTAFGYCELGIVSNAETREP